jgi:hypothetical protein
MSKPKVSFRVIGESGPLSITWSPGPLGDALEDKNGIGVGFFSPGKELLSVEFDDVNSKNDHQALEFGRFKIEINVKNGKVSHHLIELDSPKKYPKTKKKSIDRELA